MSELCEKCGSGSAIEGALYVHCMSPKYLCGFCHNTFQSMHDKLFEKFMRENSHMNVIISELLSQESWNMLKAREERKAGKSPWANNPID